MQGLLNRLLDKHDALSKKLLRDAVFYVVPNMNPDGTWRGHMRTNAAGANLNLEWAHPTAEQSPEVGLCCTEAEGHYLMCQGREGKPTISSVVGDSLSSLQVRERGFREMLLPCYGRL